MKPTDTPTDHARPTWLLPALVGGGLLLAAVLALTQPWLLWIDDVAEEQLPTIATSPEEPAAPRAEDGPPEDDHDDDAAGDMAAQDAAMTGATEEDASGPSPTPEPSREPSPEPSGPVELAAGSFISRDHATTGRVAIVRLEDGSRVLTIEDLRTDNGPDLYVYLDDDAADAPEGDFDDGIDLGRLRGNVGDLVYEIPDEVDLGDVASVAIWCDRFSSLFGAADLSTS